MTDNEKENNTANVANVANSAHERFRYKSLSELVARAESLGVKLPLSEDLSPLSSPCASSANRIVFQPMEGCDGTTDGKIGELSLRRYVRSAEGGAGLIWFEAVAVTPEARANPRQPWLNENTLSSFSETVSKIKEAGLKKNGYAPVVILQATHSGRYSKPEGKPAPIIAYNNPLFEGDSPLPASCIISDSELRRIEQCYSVTAALAEKAGFDGIDIKCCHRYLNSELLSAYERPGDYGGSLENRTRLLRNGIIAAKASTSESFIKTTRMNLYDGFKYPYGFGVKPGNGIEFEPEEPLKVVGMLRSLGVKLVNTSMGNPYVNPHINRPYDLGGYVPPEHPLIGIARLVNGVGLLAKSYPDMDFIASGLSYLREYSFNLAAGIIKEGYASFAGFGRESFSYPDFPNDLFAGTIDRRKLCVCCSKCTELMRAGSITGCVLHDKDIYLPLYLKYCSKNKQ